MYEKPLLVRYGTLRELTQDVLVHGSGDAIVFAAASDDDVGPRS
jgi:hypothetical protein